MKIKLLGLMLLATSNSSIFSSSPSTVPSAPLSPRGQKVLQEAQVRVIRGEIICTECGERMTDVHITKDLLDRGYEITYSHEVDPKKSTLTSHASVDGLAAALAGLSVDQK